MTHDWNRMLKNLRTKTYRNLQEDRTGSNCSLINRESSATHNYKPTDHHRQEQKRLEDWQDKGNQAEGSRPQVLLARGRSSSEPSSVLCRSVKFPLTSSPTPTVKEGSSITGLQQQIKAAFGRWRKRGQHSSSQGFDDSDRRSVHSLSSSHRLHEDTFDSHNVRVSPHSRTFSHPHRLTVFPPFPTSGSSPSSSPANTLNPPSKSSRSSNPFAFVRGFRSKKSDSDKDQEHAWSTSASSSFQEFTTFPLAAKSRSDHSLHRIIKDDHTWTVFATLRPPNGEKSGSLSKGEGSSAWTFGLFSDLPASQRRQHLGIQQSSLSFGERRSKGKAASVAPSPEILHRSLTPPLPQTLPPWALGRNERRTRSLERCSQQRVNRSNPAAVRPPVPTRIRSRSLEKNYTLSTNPKNSIGSSSAASDFIKSPANCNNGQTPRIPRRAEVAPEVLATWCTFSEAFGGGRPKIQSRSTVANCQDPISDERDSPGSPVFEELFLPPPKFASETHNINSSISATSKRNSVAGSSGCSGSGGHSAGVSCSSKSTPRSSPVPETVLYGSREAPVLERHCVEGGEFIIAWLSHSKAPKTSRSALAPPVSHGSTGAHHSTTPTPTGSTNTDMQHSSAANGNGGSSGGSTGSSRSFINKPARGWLHSDTVIVREGITYFVRYIGCLEVNTSMKSLDFDTRSQIAKECINIVCETAGLKTVDKKRKVDRRIQRILGNAPHMEHAGSDVALTINSGCLRINTLEGNTVVACHDMPNISFASGGDPDTLDFVAYVAKDNVHGRACYVLECGGGLAQDVITTIGQAFELRFKEYLKRAPRPSTEPSVMEGNREGPVSSGPASVAAVGATAGAAWTPDDPEYYNDLPGKVPPDFGPPPVPPLPNYHAPSGSGAASSTGAVASANPTPSSANMAVSKKGSERPARHGMAATVDLSDNLIDLNSDIPLISKAEAGATGNPFPDHEYVNGIIGSSSDFKNASSVKDPFDMHPFSGALPSPLPSALLAPMAGANSNANHMTTNLNSGSMTTARPCGSSVPQRGPTRTSKTKATPHEIQLSQEIWFHGPISRKEAEDLLKHDGDFLVRESQGSQGQYVLTGMQSGHHKHLLLVDPEGVVRTKDRTFESVSHLINYHRNNILPIISAESVLLLKRPVPRTHHP